LLLDQPDLSNFEWSTTSCDSSDRSVFLQYI